MITIFKILLSILLVALLAALGIGAALIVGLVVTAMEEHINNKTRKK